MTEQDPTTSIPFDEETWASLPDFIGPLPNPVCLNVWADIENGTEYEREAAALCRTLAERFDMIDWQLLPRRPNYAYYPVIGIMGGTAAETTDYGLRIIGLPTGMQLTTLIAGIQAASFTAQTVEPLTRIRLHKLFEGVDKEVQVEVLTIPEDEAGTSVAKTAFGFATNIPNLRVFVVMVDQFPEATVRYSVQHVPHVVINRFIHHTGPLDEEELVRQVGLALRRDAA